MVTNTEFPEEYRQGRPLTLLSCVDTEELSIATKWESGMMNSAVESYNDGHTVHPLMRSRMVGTPEWRNRPARVALIGASISFVIAVVAVVAVDAIVHHIVLGDLRNYLARTALATAALIDGDEFRRFTRPEQDSTAEYRRASRPLRVLLETNPDIRFAYSGVTTGNRMHFVLDGSSIDARDSSGAPEHAAPMFEDNASPGELAVTQTHRVTVEDKPSATAWGMGIRAQAPIFTDTGQMVGYVGLTMRADRYAHLIHRTDIAAAFGVILAGLLALATGYGILRTERLRERAERTNALLAEQLRREKDRLGQYAESLDQAESDIRRGTAKHLHEGVSQVLTGLRMMLNTARGLAGGAPLTDVLANAEDAACEAQKGIRVVIQDLWPPELEFASLAQILIWTTSLFESRYAFTLHWQIQENSTMQLSRERLLLLYRLVREVIDDLHLHSTGRSAEITIGLRDAAIQILVMDQVVGVPSSKWVERSTNSIALSRVRERVQAARGSFELRRLPGGGGEASIVIPH